VTFGEVGAKGAAKGAVKRFWEEEACGERYGDDQDRVRYELEPEIIAFAAFQESKGQDVLEIGVGMGADYVRWLRAGAKAVGIDLTERAVAITQARAEADGFPHADLRQADAEHLPFANESFDLVYSWGVLHHTPDTATAVAEAYRVLRPGGHLKVMLYNRRSWVAWAAWFRFGLLRGRPWSTAKRAVANVESPGTQAFTEREVRAMLHNFREVSLRPQLTHWDRRIAPLVAARLGNGFGWFLLVEATR
jgi:ubiquinone/menaquinone biosynthesis C-methylase UbiE